MMLSPASTSLATPAPAPAAADRERHTLWGLDVLQLHDRFWAARGVQVVRQGQPARLIPHAELFLLMDPHSLSIFRLGQLVDTLSWLKPRVVFVRLHNTREQGYQERVIAGEDDRFIRFERVYGALDWRLARVALTPHPELAQAWQNAPDVRSGWRALRRSIPPNQRTTLSVDGSVYDGKLPQEVMGFMREVVQVWKRPDATIRRARPVRDGVWGDCEHEPVNGGPAPRFIGSIWVGAGRRLDGVESVVGPAVLWDDPQHRPPVEDLRWREIEPTDVLSRPIKPRRLTSFQRISKRAFDVAFSLLVLAMTLPFYPLVMFAIWLEDGRPFFFAHQRETCGGVEFPCLKFRTMRRDAEAIKAKFQRENRSDGPHFFIEDDPRLTRMGKFLRKFNLDELPQFFNVLVGHMSVVGPRPSPYKENQYCPPWREARLSVRPGITGLWQMKRSRDAGRDFQEWIRYDIEYVERFNWKMDLWIIGKTILKMTGLR